MIKHNTTLIDTTIDRVDSSLILTRADDKKARLFRLTMQNVCYFAASGDIDAEAFEQIDQLQPGMNVRACVFEDRGRHKIAWIRSADHAIAPYDALAQKRGNLTLLPRALGPLVLSLAALAIPSSFIMALAVFVIFVSLIGCLIAISHRESRQRSDGHLRDDCLSSTHRGLLRPGRLDCRKHGSHA
ncbi:hypothetical protein [Paraburkholderia haematera]|uniref:Uncharacterized protein n=1 Tax=Paraburkholderia haematera TaxID=2793077 RepID=A0ABN7LQB4_9BURK|nr:hypothetical protein [Paraburkholderia haematera]CAE6763681.1 hypothetical protein R69888_03527 [Paraburkholderia haematera]